MKTITTLIIIILILLALGLYYIPDITKEGISITGHTTKEVAKKTYDKIKESNVTEDISEVVKNKIEDFNK
ncbi:unnamed protein product [marine sediment metagenome]|uniref:Uncharacterized protein n=1 Tax=marine sediment metagenome TaxID=412755 RepID=X1S803_9ZZZZ